MLTSCGVASKLALGEKVRVGRTLIFLEVSTTSAMVVPANVGDLATMGASGV